jgi:hypothetical protein
VDESQGSGVIEKRPPRDESLIPQEALLLPQMMLLGVEIGGDQYPSQIGTKQNTRWHRKLLPYLDLYPCGYSDKATHHMPVGSSWKEETTSIRSLERVQSVFTCPFAAT